MKLGIIKIDEENHICIIHIISDGTSVDLLLNEFCAAYKGENVQDVKVQYKYFVVWQKNLLSNENMKDKEKYWLGDFKEFIPKVVLLTDRIKDLSKPYNGDSIVYKLSDEIVIKMKKVVAVEGITMHNLVFAAYSLLLNIYSEQKDIEDLKKFLKAKLPEYMIPTYFIILAFETDYPRGEIQSFKGDVMEFSVGEELYKSLVNTT